MPLEQFLDVPDAPERSLVMVNRTEPEPFQRMLEKLFAEQRIEVGEEKRDEFEDNTVVLVEEGSVVATSPLSELQNAILMVNSDLYKTGTRKLDATETPAVIDGLTDHPFTLRGYPASDTEKLLLILLSRQIERRAYEHRNGTLRSSFQRLSRVTDEQGTRQVYETIAETDVDVHLYGRPDWVPSPDFSVTIHGGYKRDFRDSWFVIYEPPHGDDGLAALVAIEKESGTWDGFWTYDPELVRDIAADVRQHL